MRSINVAVAALIVVQAFAPSAMPSPLQGGVQHHQISGDTESESTEAPGSFVFPAKVSAVDQRFRPHKLFAESELPHENSSETWYRIPAWRAGHYHREQQVDHTITGDVVMVSRVDHVYGMQRDRKGEIWHYSSWPHVTKIDLDGVTEYKIIERYEPIEATNHAYAVKVSSIDIDVDDKTNRIKRVTKQLEVDRYTPGPNGIAYGESEWQGYSADGNPNTQVEHSSMDEMLVEPFKVADKWREKDLRASFREFLEAHGMSELVP
jgi:hypothetical protein